MYLLASTAYPSYRYRGPLIQARSILGYHIQFLYYYLILSPSSLTASCTISFSSSTPNLPRESCFPKGAYVRQDLFFFIFRVINNPPWALFGVSLLSCCSFSHSSFLSAFLPTALCPSPSHVRAGVCRLPRSSFLPDSIHPYFSVSY